MENKRIERSSKQKIMDKGFDRLLKKREYTKLFKSFATNTSGT